MIVLSSRLFAAQQWVLGTMLAAYRGTYHLPLPPPSRSVCSDFPLRPEQSPQKQSTAKVFCVGASWKWRGSDSVHLCKVSCPKALGSAPFQMLSPPMSHPKGWVAPTEWQLSFRCGFVT